MTLIKWKPNFPPLTDMFDDFFRDDDFFLDVWPKKMINVPAVNIQELDDIFLLELAAPGMKKKDFEVSVAAGCLTISAELKEEKEEVEKTFTRREFSFRSFKRTFTLPENVNSDGIKANYKEGILSIEIPKVKEKEKEPSKVIEIG